MKRMILISMLILGALLTHASKGDYYVSVDLGGGTTNGTAFSKGTNQLNTPQGGYNIDTDFVGGLGVGYYLNDNFRIETELRHRKFNSDTSLHPSNPNGPIPGNTFMVDAETKSLSLIANLYYDFEINNQIKSFIKLGLGVASNETESKLDIQTLFQTLGLGIWNYPGHKNTEFAWAIGTGIGYDISEKITMTLEYQYIDLGESETGKDVNIDWIEMTDLNSHEVTVGLNYKI